MSGFEPPHVLAPSLITSCFWAASPNLDGRKWRESVVLKTGNFGCDSGRRRFGDFAPGVAIQSKSQNGQLYFSTTGGPGSSETLRTFKEHASNTMRMAPSSIRQIPFTGLVEKSLIVTLPSACLIIGDS